MYLEAQECESILSGPGRLGQSSHVCLSRFTKQKPPNSLLLAVSWKILGDGNLGTPEQHELRGQGVLSLFVLVRSGLWLSTAIIQVGTARFHLLNNLYKKKNKNEFMEYVS